MGRDCPEHESPYPHPVPSPVLAVDIARLQEQVKALHQLRKEDAEDRTEHKLEVDRRLGLLNNEAGRIAKVLDNSVTREMYLSDRKTDEQAREKAEERIDEKFVGIRGYTDARFKALYVAMGAVASLAITAIGLWAGT